MVCFFSVVTSWFSICSVKCNPTHPVMWAWRESCKYTQMHTHTHTYICTRSEIDKHGGKGWLSWQTEQSNWTSAEWRQVLSQLVTQTFAHSEGRAKCVTLLQPVRAERWLSSASERTRPAWDVFPLVLVWWHHSCTVMAVWGFGYK